jgi:hypothetical protein
LLAPATGAVSTVLVGVAEGGIRDFERPDGPPLADTSSALDAGAALVLLDPLLVGDHGGEHERLPVDEGRHASYHGFTHAYNRTLLAERVHDVLTAIAYASGRFDGAGVNLLGTGRAGVPALLARALAGDAVERTAVDFGFDFDDVRSFDDPDFLPGGTRYGGLAGFAAAIAPGELWLVGAEEAPQPRSEWLQRTYESCGAKEHLHLVPSSEADRVLARLAGDA